jgi:hypothetical protein
MGKWKAIVSLRSALAYVGFICLIFTPVLPLTNGVSCGRSQITDPSHHFYSASHPAACSLTLGPDMEEITCAFLLLLAGEFSIHSAHQGSGDQTASPQSRTAAQ